MLPFSCSTTSLSSGPGQTMNNYLTHSGTQPVASCSGLSVNSAVADELAKKEHLQQRHYALFKELQQMSAELPQKYQQRLPYELLSSLANSLLDGTVYDIVRGLKELQTLDEATLFSTRKSVLNSHQETEAELVRRQKEQREALLAAGQSLPLISLAQEKEREAMKKMHTEEVNRLDMKIITQLDQCVSDQQVTLEKAGVPGFFVTNSPTEISIQMYLLQFILRLGSSP
ncbi:gonadal protein gdl isoform X2 [Haemaphysalis longicornis]